MSPPASASARPESTRLACMAAGIAALGGLFFGYDLAVIAGAILFITQQFGLSPLLEEVVASAAMVGAIYGTLLGGPLADRFGRRRIQILTAVVALVGALGTALAPTVAWLTAGRIVVGVALGMTAVAGPLYIAELSPDHARGRLVSLYTLAITLGILAAYLADYALALRHAWRWMFGLGAMPAVALGLGMVWLPESPRWLLSRGLVEPARTVLRRLRGTTRVDGELQRLQGSLGRQGRVWAALADPSVRLALVVGIVLAVFRAVTGFSIVVSYAPTIFAAAGLASVPVEMLATVGLGLIFVVLTLVAMRLVDRMGRRPLLLLGLGGMVLSLGVLGLAFRVPQQVGALGWIAVASLMLLAGSYTLGPGAVVMLLIAEFYPMRIRGFAISLATAAFWGAYLLATLTFLTLIDALGRPGTFWLYGMLGIAAWIFGYLFVPETKGRSLEAIEAHWRPGQHPPPPGA
jgi:SP family galactose:H+ symporter-like MFS transporter